MSTATTKTIATGSVGASPSLGSWPAPAALELTGPFPCVPSLVELEDLTDIPDRRVVFRGVIWAFYDELVESIPEWRKIHVDYDGKDLEIVRYGMIHEVLKCRLGSIISIIAEVSGTPFMSLGGPTLKRPEASRGLEPDAAYLFNQERRVATYAALKRRSHDIADYPSPELAVEVDITPSQVDRAGIYAALGVTEVWRFAGWNEKGRESVAIIIERLTPAGRYAAVEASGFLPIRADDVLRWLVEDYLGDDTTFARRFRAYINTIVCQ